MAELDPLPAVVALAGALMAFLAGGSYVNRRRAGTMANNMKPAFLALGPATITWLGRSAFRYDVERPRQGFAQVAAMAQLLPRDLPFSWMAAALMGKKDMMTLRANLRSPPRVEFEAFVDEGYVGRRMREVLQGLRWPTARLDGRIVVAAPREALPSVRQRLAPHAEGLGRFWRLSVSPAEPHITANFDPGGPPGLHEARMKALLGLAASLVADEVPQGP